MKLYIILAFRQVEETISESNKNREADSEKAGN